MFSFKTNLGKNKETDGSTLDMCLWLCKKTDILCTRGHVLFTENFYTTIKLTKHMYEIYGWSVVGTMTTTKKKHREKEEFPFLKMSNRALNMIPRGWFPEAAIKAQESRSSYYYIQATTW